MTKTSASNSNTPSATVPSVVRTNSNKNDLVQPNLEASVRSDIEELKRQLEDCKTELKEAQEDLVDERGLFPLASKISRDTG